MSRLRTLVSAACIVLGALLIAVWAASWAVLSALDDGTSVDRAIATAIDSPVVRDSIAASMGDRALAALGDAGVDTATPGVQAGVRAALAAASKTDGFRALLTSQISAAREQVVAALKDGTGAGRPIDVSINVTDFVNTQVGGVPVVGSLLPEVTLAPVSVEVMDARKADDARRAYDWMSIAAHWFLWIGIGVFALGVVVSHRRRWYFAKVSLAGAVLSAIAWALLTFVDAQTLAGWMPGGADGSVGRVVATVFAAGASSSIARRMAAVAVGATIVSGVLFAVDWSSRPVREVRR